MPFQATEAVRCKLGIGAEFLLAVGTLEPRKNLSTLVEAFAEIKRVQPQSKLQLVFAGGRGWLTDSLFAAIEKSAVRNSIVLTDYLHDNELRALYASCRAFIYPSIYEGFGLPPLEAMACGAPVIASRIPAVVETTGAAAQLFDPGDVAELMRCVLELLTDGKGRRELSIAGQRRAAEFSWKKTARQTFEVYTEAFRRFRAGVR
jgi:glycosyltransferase involved in cell wall biosynthesis